jgi:hypothetical protein
MPPRRALFWGALVVLFTGSLANLGADPAEPLAGLAGGDVRTAAAVPNAPPGASLTSSSPPPALNGKSVDNQAVESPIWSSIIATAAEFPDTWQDEVAKKFDVFDTDGDRLLDAAELAAGLASDLEESSAAVVASSFVGTIAGTEGEKVRLEDLLIVAKHRVSGATAAGAAGAPALSDRGEARESSSSVVEDVASPKRMRIVGLKQHTDMNGLRGYVRGPVDESTGRLAFYAEGGDGTHFFIKPENLVPDVPGVEASHSNAASAPAPMGSVPTAPAAPSLTFLLQERLEAGRDSSSSRPLLAPTEASAGSASPELHTVSWENDNGAEFSPVDRSLVAPSTSSSCTSMTSSTYCGSYVCGKGCYAAATCSVCKVPFLLCHPLVRYYLVPYHPRGKISCG